MLPSSVILLAAAIAPAPDAVPAPQLMHGGVQAIAMATAEVLPAARGTVEPGPQEPRRQARREPNGQIVIEFE